MLKVSLHQREEKTPSWIYWGPMAYAVLNIQVLQFLQQFQKRSRLENDQVSDICPLTTSFYHFINASCRNDLDTGQTYRILSNYQFKSF